MAAQNYILLFSNCNRIIKLNGSILFEYMSVEIFQSEAFVTWTLFLLWLIQQASHADRILNVLMSWNSSTLIYFARDTHITYKFWRRFGIPSLFVLYFVEMMTSGIICLLISKSWGFTLFPSILGDHTDCANSICQLRLGILIRSLSLMKCLFIAR